MINIGIQGACDEAMYQVNINYTYIYIFFSELVFTKKCTRPKLGMSIRHSNFYVCPSLDSTSTYVSIMSKGGEGHI